jgi:hypothetical protein
VTVCVTHTGVDNWRQGVKSWQVQCPYVTGVAVRTVSGAPDQAGQLQVRQCHANRADIAHGDACESAQTGVRVRAGFVGAVGQAEQHQFRDPATAPEPCGRHRFGCGLVVR